MTWTKQTSYRKLSLTFRLVMSQPEGSFHAYQSIGSRFDIFQNINEIKHRLQVHTKPISILKQMHCWEKNCMKRHQHGNSNLSHLLKSRSHRCSAGSESSHKATWNSSQNTWSLSDLWNRRPLRVLSGMRTTNFTAFSSSGAGSSGSDALLVANCLSNSWDQPTQRTYMIDNLENCMLSGSMS